MTILIKHVTGLIFLLHVFNLSSQNCGNNLILNGGFEEKNYCPTGFGELNACYNWFNPILSSSPDYFNSCWLGIPQNNVSIPNNLNGHQFSLNGQAYIGICLDSKYELFGAKNYREYITIKLSEPLKKCNKYKIIFHINLSDSSNYKTEKISTLFTKDSIGLYFGDTMFLYIPQLNFNIFEADTQNWYKFEGIYLSQGGEEYLTIGNFLDSNNINSTRIKYFGGYDVAYYYIDDVSLCELSDHEPNIPNIITPNQDGINDAFVIEYLPANHELWVYNRWGNQVYFSSNYQNNWSPPDLSTGVYFYILKPPCGDSYKGTVTVVGEK